MKRLKRGVTLLLCLAALLLCVSPAAGARREVYFMAVNDTPLELSASTMPIRVGGVLYVPYYMFSATITGVNLSVYAAYNPSRSQVLVYSNHKQLIFDLAANTAYDLDGNTYSNHGMVRGSTVYLPVALVCSVFSDLVWYSVSTTPYGQLVRVKNASVVLDDRSYIDAADGRMSSMYEKYLQDNPGSLDPEPTPSRSLGQGAQIFLAFTLDAPEDADRAALTDSVLDALDRRDARALFFFTPEEMAEQDGLVRRLVGSGHLVGARLAGDTAELALAQLERAKDTLAAAARCRVSTVLCEGLDEDGLAAVSQAGAVCWTTSADGRDPEGSGAVRADALLRRLTAGEDAANRLLLDMGAGSSLSALLDAVAEEEFQLRTPIPTELQPRS